MPNRPFRTLSRPHGLPESFPQPTVPPSRINSSHLQIPRNTSVTGLVAKAFETSEQQRNLALGKVQRSLYSRHLLEKVPPSPTTSLVDDEIAYVMTLPYGKNPRLAAKIRQFGLALQDHHRNKVIKSNYPPNVLTNNTDISSAPRSTDPPPPRPPIPFRFTVECEGIVPPTKSGCDLFTEKPERTIIGSNKTFTVGEETRELLPIREERDVV
ncbi:hypothetical protein DICVIV_06816 [Dictyocaulus viviparus]|uniref:Uncharacterized protein n=1 Tax=Dictyocaulus viviparus TaxID=29172 RepID=A0A0D8XQZ8_DICVI|nr:hypothetical protein DICVIV_06816 [Dictyocaulus viviparus]